MVKHLAIILALALGFGVASSLLVAPSVLMAAKKSKKVKKAKKARKAKRARRAKKGAAAAAEAEEAQEKAEDRQGAAQFSWIRRPSGAGMDVRADKKRDEAIAKLKRLLPTVPEGDQKAELVFRLSEMYWAKSKFMSLRAMRIWDEQLEAWHEKGGRGPQPKLEEVAELDEGDLFKREALKLYRRILDRYPRYHRKDEVLYNLGSSLYESGKKKDGMRMYWDLIKQYPDSPYVADSYLQLGEHFFNSNKLTQAIKTYERAAATKKSRIYSYALYKLAWCDYNLQEYDKALDKFRQVIAYAKKKKAGGRAGEYAENDRIQLLEESLADIVRVYSHLDAIDEAVEFYWKEVGKGTKEKPGPAYKYLYKLAKFYDAEGKYSLEIKMYRRLNDEYPYAPRAPQNHANIMKAYAQLSRPDNVRNEVRRMIDLYSPNGLWAKKNAGDQKVLTAAFESVEQELATLVTDKHREAQQTKLVQTYKLARDIYDEYLNKFDDTINSYKFRFFYAEILFELKQFDKAAVQYAKVVDKKSKGEFAKAAAYTTILSWEKVLSGVKENLGKKIIEQKGKRATKAKGALRQLEKITELKKGKSYDEEPLNETELKLAAACDRFVEIAPKDDEVVKVKFKSARLYFIHNHFEKAAERFGEIIDRWPKDKLARLGAESILQSFNVREDWSQLNQWSRKFRDHKLLMADKGFAKKVHEFVEGASFNEIHFVFEPKAEPLEIAGRYAGFVKEFPKSKYAMVGLFNSVVNYDKSNLLEKSIKYGEMTLKDYKSFKIDAAEIAKSKKEGSTLPKPEDLREKILFMVASFYERLAEFKISAGYYEQYVKEFKNGEKRADAYFNTGILREGLGEYDKSLAAFRAYIKEYPKQKDAADIAWRIGLILEKKKDFKASLSHFADYSKGAGKKAPARAICADFKVVQAYLKLGKSREAKAGYAGLIKSYNKLKDADKKKPCPLDAAGAAAFAEIDPDYQAYLAIDLKAKKDKDVAKKLIDKMTRVDDLQKRFTKVLQIGQGDFGIASLYRIGFMYQHLAQAIFETPCPRILDEDQCMIYEAELQAKAFPLEEKAIEAYDKALTKAYELGLYNEWLAKAQDALKTYEPGRFPEIHQYDLIASEQVFEVPDVMEAH